MPPLGIEPSTFSLQSRCSTIWATEAKKILALRRFELRLRDSKSRVLTTGLQGHLAGSVWKSDSELLFSDAGNRTRISGVKTPYPKPLDYIGEILVFKSANNSDAPSGNRTHVSTLEELNSTTELLALMRGVGIEPTWIAPADLKPAALTTRPSPL